MSEQSYPMAPFELDFEAMDEAAFMMRWYREREGRTLDLMDPWDDTMEQRYQAWRSDVLKEGDPSLI